MDAEKVIEVEMKAITPEVQDDKDVEKGKMEETKESENGAKVKEDKKEKDVKEEESSVYCKLKTPTEDIYNTSVPSSSSKTNEEVEIKVEEEKKKEKEIEEESNVYSKLKSPTEDIYNPSMPSSSKRYKEGKKEEENEEAEDVYCKLNDPAENVYMTTMSKDIYRRAHLYKKIAAFFIVLSLLLLAVVLALAMKSNVKCPESAEPNCELCQTTCPPLKGIRECHCSECDEDWEMFENSCYFFSDDRLNWQESREACQKLGGDLVVIDNERVQRFLTEDRGMFYWIGFHYSEDQKWMWINNTAPTQSFWSNGQPKPDVQGSCALLNSGTSDLSNWLSNPCTVISQYICQKC